MTDFLHRTLPASECGKLNHETDRLFAYHDATKHSYRSVRTSGRALDWRNQPNPFRTYEGAAIVPLPPNPGLPDAGTFRSMALVARAATMGGNTDEPESRVQLDALLLSGLLWHSMAVSAVKKVPRTGDLYTLRVNPSSGNLHPTETYLALRGFEEIDDGLYHYRADLHALERRASGAYTRKLALAAGAPGVQESGLIVAFTSIFWREAWKYGNRAYRYCCLDLGHAMMSVLVAAEALGLPGGAMTHFGDLRVARVLGVEQSDEAPMAVLAFETGGPNSPPIPVEQPFAGTPNALSAEETRYELLLNMHCATVLPDTGGEDEDIHAPELAGRPGAPSAIAAASPHLNLLPEYSTDSPLAAVVRRRRSALDFDPATAPMQRAELEQMLDVATRDWPADWKGTLEPHATQLSRSANLVTLQLFVHRVQGCDPGVYRWDAEARALEQLHRGNVERVAAFLSLEQPVAGNSCVTISMIANLAEAARLFGNRGYRYVHFEAGAIGQRLYLAAEALSWNATGIGAFYDDDVHRYLGFLADDEAATGSHTETAMHAAERQSLVMLGSPASRLAAHPSREALRPAAKQQSNPATSSLAPRGAERFPPQAAPPPSPEQAAHLSHQVIYHLAIGRAIHDPRLSG